MVCQWVLCPIGLCQSWDPALYVVHVMSNGRSPFKHNFNKVNTDIKRIMMIWVLCQERLRMCDWKIIELRDIFNNAYPMRTAA